jgi:hypothetical protein
MGFDTAPLLKMPHIEASSARTTKDIYVRAIIHTEIKALTLYPDTFDETVEWIEETRLDKYLSESERAVLARRRLSEQETISYSWYSESLYMYMVVLGLVGNKFGPNEEADMEPYVGIFPPNGSLKKLEAAIKRVPDDELFVLRDTYFLLHRLVRHGHSNLNTSVVVERRKALEWMADDRLEWDDMPLDT